MAHANTDSTERLVEAAMAILQAVPDMQMNIVVLNKALFYLDLVALRDFGKMVTNTRYVALPQGPVVDDYKIRLVGELVRRGWATQVAQGMAKPVKVARTLQAFPHLTHEEVSYASRVAAELKPLLSKTVSQRSHNNPGWIRAHARGSGTMINMHLALQQIAEIDPWLDEPVDAATLEEIASAGNSAVLWE